MRGAHVSMQSTPKKNDCHMHMHAMSIDEYVNGTLTLPRTARTYKSNQTSQTNEYQNQSLINIIIFFVFL